MTRTLTGCCLAIILLMAPVAQAYPNLYAWMFNIDGVVTEYVDPYSAGGMPVNAELDAEDLGVFTYTETAQGAHNFIGYFDYEFDEPVNTYFNERGTVTGNLGLGQSWQIDSMDNYEAGNIFDNVYDGALNNTNNVTLNGDVSWALGWDYFLEENQQAVIRMVVGAVIPDADFYLTHIDNTTGERIYLSSSMNIQPVPEPQSVVLLSMGCLLLLAARGVSKKYGQFRESTGGEYP